MATNGKKWWRQPWVWIVAVPVVIVGALTASHQPSPSATTTADPAISITVPDTTPPAVTTTTDAVPTTTVALPPPPPPPTAWTAPAPPPAPPATTDATDSGDLCGAPPNPLGYTYCDDGPLVVAPSQDTCRYFHCISNWANGRGHMEECRDGDVSMSGGRPGSCSYHGGDESAVYQS